MSDKTAEASPSDSSAELRGTLIKRLAVAGALVAVLLGVLAFFDYLAAPEEPEPTVYTKPVPVPPKKEVTQPVKPAASLPEPPKPEAEPEKPAEAPAPVEPPPKPAVAAQPALSEPRTEAKPAPAVRPAAPAASTAPAAPAPAGATAVPQAPAAKPATTTLAPETVAVPQEAASTTPKPVEAAPARLQPSAAPRLFTGYLLQAGVFSNVQRAEELHAKLALNGIPSSLEARVQVGPFKTKAEADAAREKMQSLGIDAVMIPPRGGKR